MRARGGSPSTIKKTEGKLILLAFVTLLSGCERTVAEDPPEEKTLGTFHAEAGQMSGGGFEAMEGPASFEAVSGAEATTVLLIRLASKLPNLADTTVLDFAYSGAAAPGRGEHRVADPEDVRADSSNAFVGCFRSPNFFGAVYQSESGEVLITDSGGEQLKGTFDLVTYTLISTGPTTSERSRLRIRGSFHARGRETGVQPESVFSCGS